MIVPLIVFFACALLAVVGAVLLILAHEPIHSALSLVLVMVALAILYLLLGAPFVAAIQILVYAGAIMTTISESALWIGSRAAIRAMAPKMAKAAHPKKTKKGRIMDAAPGTRRR